MKTKSGIVCGALLALSASWPAGAGEIVDTYSSGDRLTATMMNNIKAAVNDNNNTALRFYGDGSAGDLNVVSGSSLHWYFNPVDNLNFRNVTIENGATLIVPAGTTIRCTGRFTNNGTIRVLYGGRGGYRSYAESIASGSWTYTGVTASPGDTGVSSSPGALGTGDILEYGYGGSGIPRTVAASEFMMFRWGGGGGSATRSRGTMAGGLLKVLCRGEIQNAVRGAILAEGLSGGNGSGSGGGGGGIVVLASVTGVVNEGRIGVPGGMGSRGSTSSAGGGGGGGGIVILVAPEVNNTGTVDVSGGAAGYEDSTTGTATGMRYAGGGGGGSGGAGGNGGGLNRGGVSVPAEAGADGYLLEIRANPATMM